MCETFLKGTDKIDVPGYEWYGRNRKELHKSAKRGSGGVGVLVKQELFELYDVHVLDDSKEDILWLKFRHKTISDCNICICSCYLPPNNRNRDADEFYDDLLQQTYCFQNEGLLYIAGDFNSRCGEEQDYIAGVDGIPPRDILDHTSNEFGEKLIDFLTSCNLCMLNGRVYGESGSNNFSCVSKRGKSVVDYALTANEQLPRCKSCNVFLMSDLINRCGIQFDKSVPDHGPIMWTVDVQSHDSEACNDKIQSSNSTWYDTRKIPSDFLKTTEALTERIKDLETNLHETQNINTAYAKFIGIIEDELNNRDVPFRKIPSGPASTKRRKSLYKPHWNKELSALWNTVCEKEKVWLNCTEHCLRRKLRTDFCEIRKTFDKTNRRYKRQYQAQQQDMLITRYGNSNKRDFWKQFGKIGIANDRSNRIPVKVETQNGFIFDHGAVLDRWKADYNNLLNVPLSDDFDAAHLEDIKHGKHTFLEQDCESLNETISEQEVRKSIYQMKLGKCAGIDNIVSECIRNEACIVLLHTIISKCFETGKVPDLWLKGIINPIPKNDSGRKWDPMSYRGITLLSIPSKVYTNILNTRLSQWLEDCNVLVDEQNGFRKERNCVDHIYVLNSIINNRKSAKQQTFACFVDAKKAFDGLNRSCLLFKLKTLGIHGKFLDSIESLYENVSCSVKVNSSLTEWFQVTQGVKQGCVLSPTLFSIYVNDLVKELNAVNCGIEIDGKLISALLYADDIVLLAPDENKLQSLLNVLSNWCRKWRLVINKEKTKIVHFRNPRVNRCTYNFNCGKLNIAYSSEYKYLGIWLNEFGDYSFSARELAKSANRALAVIKTKFIQFGGFSLNVYNKLYEALVLPILSYASGIWGVNTHRCINVLQNNACKFYLGLTKRSSNIASRGDMGWLQGDTILKIELFRYWNRIKLKGNNLCTSVHQWSIRRKTSWDYRVFKLGKELHVLENENDIVCLDNVKLKLAEKDVDHWSQSLWDDKTSIHGNKLRSYRKYKSLFGLETYVEIIKNKSHRRVLSKLRAGSLPLRIETGRFLNPPEPLCDRICLFCNNNQVEDEEHFVLNCNFYNHIREPLCTRACQIEPFFTQYDNVNKMYFFMNNPDILPHFASCVYRMFNCRQHAALSM